ncbi:MAG: hypothetical protein AAFO79_06560 [Pseudomonadota bacterium]
MQHKRGHGTDSERAGWLDFMHRIAGETVRKTAIDRWHAELPERTGCTGRALSRFIQFQRGSMALRMGVDTALKRSDLCLATGEKSPGFISARGLAMRNLTVRGLTMCRFKVRRIIVYRLAELRRIIDRQ